MDAAPRRYVMSNGKRCSTTYGRCHQTLVLSGRYSRCCWCRWSRRPVRLAVSAWQSCGTRGPPRRVTPVARSRHVLVPAILFSPCWVATSSGDRGQLQADCEIAARPRPVDHLQRARSRCSRSAGWHNDQTPTRSLRHTAPSVPAGHQPLDRQGDRAEPSSSKYASQSGRANVPEVLIQYWAADDGPTGGQVGPDHPP